MGELDIVMGNALKISSGQRAVPISHGHPARRILGAILDTDLWVHAALRWTFGSPTRCPVHTRCIPVKLLGLELCIAKIQSAVIQMAIGSQGQLIAMVATSMLSGSKLKISMALDPISRRTPQRNSPS